MRANARNVSAVDDGADETVRKEEEMIHHRLCANDWCHPDCPALRRAVETNRPVTHVRRTRYKFVGRDARGFYVWESELRMPGDSRVEQITCPPSWFWGRHPIPSWCITRQLVGGHDLRCDSDWCHPDCSVRREAIENDHPYPGKRV